MGIITAEYLGQSTAIFRGKTGQKLARLFMHITALDKINDLHDRNEHLSGTDFTTAALEDLGINYLVGNTERLKNLPQGAFITVSNHPYGGLDGVIMVDLFGRLRPDYKFMVNKILSLVRGMSKHFIVVTSTGNKKTSVTATSLKGVKDTIAHLRQGHPMGFFPSGAVSDFSLKDLRIRDRVWQDSLLRLIHMAKVPVIPVRFFDHNSPFFYSLGLINWRIRLLRMPWELFNKRKKQPRLGIGDIITVEQQQQFKDHTSLGAFLRQQVYNMPLPDTFTPKTEIFAGK